MKFPESNARLVTKRSLWVRQRRRWFQESMPYNGSRTKPTSGSQSTKRQRSAVTSVTISKDTLSEDDKTSGHQFELLQYDWPDLPPIPKMKDAICRQTVSRGISYLLPVDMGRNSINCKYRTDLRSMFQEPYVRDDHQYNDVIVGLSSKVHFRINQASARWTPQLARSLPAELNASSESARKSYARSAPVNGSKRGLGYGLAPRSVHDPPLRTHIRKSELSPDMMKLKQEAEAMIKQTVMESDTGPVGEKGQVTSDNLADQIVSSEHNWSVQTNLSCSAQSPSGNLSRKIPDIGQTDPVDSSLAQNYEEFLNTLSGKCRKNRIPDRFVSPYLHEEQNQEIWEWLHHGESI
ncbi:hypothetical protein Btru_060080, partial [Bulinus truncatus]